MNTKSKFTIIVAILALLATACGTSLVSSAPTATPTSTPVPTRPKPTVTPTNTPDVAILAGPTDISAATEESAAVPSPFDISMLFTNGSCGTGTPTWDYTFTIDDTGITQVQTNGIGGPVVVTLTGMYDPAIGAFGTSADVGTGIENYDGAISFDGTIITVTGSYSYTPTGGTACTFDFEGTTTP